MIPERWQQISDMLHQAMQLDTAQRSVFLEQLAANDPEMHRELESLLDAHDNAESGFLDGTPTDSFANAVSPMSMAGQRFGDYRIIERIGVGGMGEVYRAVRDDDQYQKEVAIKVVRAGQNFESVVSRFRNERQILASLDHPNIARLFDGGTTQAGVPFFVMELIRGEPIDQYCHRRNLALDERLELFLQVCSAVQFAHQRLIIHRDIKPGNILVTSEGVPKLLDFGIAKVLDEDAALSETKTLTAFRLLTPAYASPEQIKDEPITTASDVYSLGVVLYELITGRHPYRQSDTGPQDMAWAVCETEPEKPSTAVRRKTAEPITQERRTDVFTDQPDEKLSKRLRGDLDNIVLMALRKDPKRRYTSAEQFAADLRRHLDNLPVIARKDTVRYRTAKFVARHKAGVFAAVCVAAILLVALIVTFREAQIARQQAALAREQRARAEQRFNDVRKLANSLIFEVHDSIRDLPGSTAARKLIMDRAAQYLDSLTQDSSDDSSLQRDLAVAYHRLGQVQGDPNQGNLGDTDAMLASINKSAALYEEVAKANPNSAPDQINAAMAHRFLASISPQAEERRRHIDQALAIIDRLLKSGISTPAVKSERSFELGVLGSLQNADGDIPASVESYRQGLAVREEVFASDPDHPHGKRWLAGAKVEAATEMDQMGLRKEALQLNAAAISLYEAILAKENDTRAARELAYSHFNRGEMFLADKNFSEALQNYRIALAQAKPMQTRDPQNVMLGVDVGGNTVNVGKALALMGQVNQGLQLMEEGIRLLEQQMKADPSDATDAAVAGYIWRGDAFAELGKFADAAESDRKAISILEESSHVARAYQPAICQLAAPYVKLGDALARIGNVPEAEQAYRKAMGVVAPLKKGGIPRLGAAYILADAYFGLGDLAKRAAERSSSDPTEQLRHWNEAHDWYNKSQQMWHQIPNPGFVNPQGFQCGIPARASAALSTADAAIQRLSK